MSRLLKNSEDYRNTLLQKNKYNKNDEYVFGHEDSLSDGDNFGRGETSTIGTAIDIAKRKELLAKNPYNKNNEYNLSNA